MSQKYGSDMSERINGYRKVTLCTNYTEIDTVVASPVQHDVASIRCSKTGCAIKRLQYRDDVSLYYM